MSLTPPEPEDAAAIEVTIFTGGKQVSVRHFETLLEAEAFAEQWIEQDPSAHYKIEDGARDHSAWEAVSSETALDADYPPLSWMDQVSEFVD